MFYCEKCRKDRDWPEAFTKSYGRCEICEQTAECHDRPSKSLPDSRERARKGVHEGANLSARSSPKEGLPREKPTLGIMPRWRWVELRIDALVVTLMRYAKEKRIAPGHLLEELDEHQKWLRESGSGNGNET